MIRWKWLFWFKPVKWTIIRENCFLLKMRHLTAKLSFSGILKHFFRNWQKKLYSRTKKWISQKETKNSTEEFFFLNVFEKRKILKKGFDSMEMLLFFKPVKLDFYYRKKVLSSNKPHTAKLSYLVYWRIFAEID